MLSTCIIVDQHDDDTGPKRRGAYPPSWRCLCTLGPSPHSIILPPSYCPPAAHRRSLTGPLFVISPFRTLSFPKVPRNTGSGKYGPRHDSRQGKTARRHPRTTVPSPGGRNLRAGPPTASISNQPPPKTTPAQPHVHIRTPRPTRRPENYDRVRIPVVSSPPTRARLPPGHPPPLNVTKTPPSLHPVVQNTHMPGGKLSLAPRTARACIHDPRTPGHPNPVAVPPYVMIGFLDCAPIWVPRTVLKIWSQIAHREGVQIMLPSLYPTSSLILHTVSRSGKVFQRGTRPFTGRIHALATGPRPTSATAT